jgi:hypothetical protein
MSSELPCGKMPAAIQKMLRQSKKYNATGNTERSYISSTTVLDQHKLIRAGAKMHMGVDGK